MTVKEYIDAATAAIGEHRGDRRDPAARELSLAITALEDAQMRYTRARAMELGVFAPADLDKFVGDPAAASRFLAERDQRAADAAKD